MQTRINKGLFFWELGGAFIGRRDHLECMRGCGIRWYIPKGVSLSALDNLSLSSGLSLTGSLSLTSNLSLTGDLSLSGNLSALGRLALLGGGSLLTGLGFALTGNLSALDGSALLGASLSLSETTGTGSFAELDGKHQELTHFSILSGQGSNHIPDGRVLLGHLNLFGSESLSEFSNGEVFSQSCERFAK